MVIVGCPASGALQIFDAFSMDVIANINQYQNVGFGNSWSVLSLENDLQVQVFLPLATGSVAMIEVIYNINLSPSEQYVSIVELLNFPTSNLKNNGMLNTAAGSNFLLAAY